MKQRTLRKSKLKNKKWLKEKFYDNLSGDEFKTKSNKNVYVENDVMATVIKRFQGRKKRHEWKIDGLRKKLIIPESQIQSVQTTKIGNIFVKEKMLEEYSVLLIKLILIFMRITKKNYKLAKMGVNIYYLEFMFILLNIF